MKDVTLRPRPTLTSAVVQRRFASPSLSDYVPSRTVYSRKFDRDHRISVTVTTASTTVLTSTLTLHRQPRYISTSAGNVSNRQAQHRFRRFIGCYPPRIRLPRSQPRYRRRHMIMPQPRLYRHFPLPVRMVSLMPDERAGGAYSTNINKLKVTFR